MADYNRDRGCLFGGCVVRCVEMAERSACTIKNGIMMNRPPLIDRSQTDRALRDLMPLVEWLTNANTASREGAATTAEWSLAQALQALRMVPKNSPAIKAYIRWLEQNTELGIEECQRGVLPDCAT